MTWKLPISGPWRTVADYVQIIVGSVLVGIGVNLFFVPNQVVSGGVTGVAILIHYAFGLPVGLMTLVFNLPLLLIGWKWAGGFQFLVRTGVSVAVLAAAIDLTGPYLVAPTTDRLLVICYGGLLDGLGLGLVFRGRGTTGGTDVIARIAHRFLGLGIGQTLLITNIAIFAVAALQFGAEAVMVALALAFVSSRVLDMVQAGLSTSRQAMIITEDPDGVRDAIFSNLHRGVTLLEARGGFTGRPRPMLYVVVGAHEVGRLKLRVAEVDPHAFVAISSAQEVFGEGFAPADPQPV
ncbi:MAG: YitT family protein [Candidatus Sulfomarinibacteraceae bacterium]